MTKGVDRQRNWKGQADRVAEPVRHRWQVDAGAGSRDSLNEPVRHARRNLTLLLVLCVGLLSFFVYTLLHAPVKTPVIAVGTTNYTWPFPPNAWAKEDILGLTSLHNKSIHLSDSTKAWQSKSSSLEDLRTKLKELAPLARRSGSLVLYLNMHGAVNEQGEACVIPPGTSPLLTSQWITIEELGAVITSHVPSGTRVLLVLDCVHHRTHWTTAQINNTFVDRVEMWANSTRPKSVVVLTSTSADQQSWSGSELHSSIFGREFRLGLAGAADRLGGLGSGNDDGAVSVRELADYLTTSVDVWTQGHRHAPQLPRVLPTVFEDFRTSWALKSGELNRQLASSRHADVAISRPTADELAELWGHLDGLRALGAYQYDPKNWADLEQKLIWLEGLSSAGEAYYETAMKQVYPQLNKRLKDSLARANENNGSNNEFAKWTELQDQATNEGMVSQLPSLVLREYVNELPTQKATLLRGSISSAVLDGISMSQVVASAGLSPESLSWNEFNFAELIRKYDGVSAWPNRTDVQQLLELRDRAERLAVSGDVRSHRWRRNELSLADVERRNAEDKLFLGPNHSSVSSNNDQHWESLRKRIEFLESNLNGSSNAFDFALSIRDRGLAEITHLANWICSPDVDFENLGEWSTSDAEGENSIATQDTKNHAGNTDPFFREQLAIQQLKRLSQCLSELSELVGSGAETGNKIDRLNEVALQAKRDLSSLNALVVDHIDRSLRGTSDSNHAFREIESLLRLPFIPVERRKLLYKRLQQLANTQDNQAKPAPDEDTESPFAAIASKIGISQSSGSLTRTKSNRSEGKLIRYSERMRNWNSHPLGEILKLEDGLSMEVLAARANSTASDMEKDLIAIDVANARLRQCFQSMLSFGSARIDDWAKIAGIGVPANSNSPWEQAAFAEKFERSVVPVCPVKFDTNASRAHRRLAFKDLLVWYAHRTASDFYASAIETSSVHGGTTSYFEDASQALLHYASTIQETSPDIQDEIQRLTDRLQVLGPIARNGLKTTVKLGPPVLGSKTDPFEVDVVPAIPNTSDDSTWRLPIPEGHATVLVRNPKGFLPGVRREVALPVPSKSPSLNLQCPTLNRTLPHEMVVVYRGHEFTAPMFAGQGIVVEYAPSHFDEAELIVFGNRPKQPSIVFVLDCSWSMGEELPVEAIALNSQSRLEIAKESILRMLSQIAAKPDARVGIRLFGSRLGWSRPVDEKTGLANGKSQILVQPNYPNSIPTDLVPSRDVENLLPLGLFRTEMMGDLRKKLSKVTPWGQSPLYLSIIESFKDFRADDSNTAKSIVVITDGDNFQFNASGRPGGEPNSSTTLDDVYRAWNVNKVPLFILGVGVSKPESKDARKNLMSLAERTKGKYYDIEDDSDLMNALSEQLSMGTYRVTRTGDGSIRGEPDPGIEAKLNTVVSLKNLSRGSAFDVSVQSAFKSVQFQGGESLEMYLSDDGQDILSKPYDRSSPKAATLFCNGESGRLIARAHMPIQQADGILFPISVQNPDFHYTPRPEQLWIEVVPVFSNAGTVGQTYVFYDVNYQSKTPVPIVNWLASNWPTESTVADVRIWAKYSPTPSVFSLELGELGRNERRFAEGLQVTGVEGVSLRINLLGDQPNSEKWEIQIAELHTKQSRGVGSIRLQLDSGNILPTRVTHRFEPSNQMVVHTYEFESSAGRALLQSAMAKLKVQTRTACHEGAWQLQADQPIRVHINTAPETLPLSMLPSKRDSLRR